MGRCSEHLEFYTHFWPHMDVLGLVLKARINSFKGKLRSRELVAVLVLPVSISEF